MATIISFDDSWRSHYGMSRDGEPIVERDPYPDHDHAGSRAALARIRAKGEGGGGVAHSDVRSMDSGAHYYDGGKTTTRWMGTELSFASAADAAAFLRAVDYDVAVWLGNRRHSRSMHLRVGDRRVDLEAGDVGAAADVLKRVGSTADALEPVPSYLAKKVSVADLPSAIARRS